MICHRPDSTKAAASKHCIEWRKESYYCSSAAVPTSLHTSLLALIYAAVTETHENTSFFNLFFSQVTIEQRSSKEHVK